MRIKDVMKTLSGIWDALDNLAFALFVLFVVAGLAYAGIKYLAG